MSDNKKYYYLKLKDNFFDTDAMIILENMQDGYLYSNILLKLYLRSLKNEGKLMFNDFIPYNSSVLAQVTRHQVGTVEKALKTFKELGLVDILDNGAIYMLDIQNYIGSSSSEADRKRLYRSRIDAEKGNKMIEGDICPDECTDISPPEIELELKKEIELKKKKEVRHKYGEYKKVLLTDKQYNKLVNDFGEHKLMYLIKKMDEWLQMTGRSYKDYNLALRKWERDDKDYQPEKSQYADLTGAGGGEW